MKLPQPKSKGEEALALQLRAERIAFEREVKFHPTRKWRFDFLLPEKVAIEVEGFGRHQTYKGYSNDCEKYCEAALLGFRVLRFTTAHVTSGYAIDIIRRTIR